jgi:anaerobic C4-dicarboxylate transporter
VRIEHDLLGDKAIPDDILNHSFIIPGIVATVSPAVIAFLIGKVVL